MPPLEASWAVSQRARHPIGPWGLMVVSNHQPIAYDAIALPIELIKYGRVFYTDYHPNVRKPTSHPVPSDSHIGGFCIVLSPVFFHPHLQLRIRLLDTFRYSTCCAMVWTGLLSGHSSVAFHWCIFQYAMLLQVDPLPLLCYSFYRQSAPNNTFFHTLRIPSDFQLTKPIHLRYLES